MDQKLGKIRKARVVSLSERQHDTRGFNGRLFIKANAKKNTKGVRECGAGVSSVFVLANVSGNGGKLENVSGGLLAVINAPLSERKWANRLDGFLLKVQSICTLFCGGVFTEM